MFDIQRGAGWFKAPPPIDDFVINGLARGSVGALIAPGGTGKSMFALQLACAVAGGQEANTLKLDIKQQGAVIYASFEDSLADIQRRIHNIGKYLSAESQSNIESNLHYLTETDEGAFDLMQKGTTSALIATATKVGCKLLIIDTLSDVHLLDENDNSSMSKVIKQLRTIARQANIAVIYLHHTSKAATLLGQGTTQQAARGASALIDKVRWCSTLSNMTDEETIQFKVSEEKRGNFIKYIIAKQNHGRIEDKRWYERADDGILREIVFSTTRTKKARGSHVL